MLILKNNRPDFKSLFHEHLNKFYASYYSYNPYCYGYNDYGYEYDDEKEGVKFEDLPEDWVCPLCGVGKDMFEKVEK